MAHWKAAVITIGDELLTGKTVNTNAAYIGQQLTEIGIEVIRTVTIADDKQAIIGTLKSVLPTVKLCILTGGLGPTDDDITKKTVAQFYRAPLRKDEKILQAIEERYRSFGYKNIPYQGRRQADVPRGAVTFSNPAGVAPALLFTRSGKVTLLLPGVPAEMKALMQEHIIPYLVSQLPKSKIMVHTIRTFGVGETVLAEAIQPVIKRWQSISLAYLPGYEGVDLRLTIKNVTDAVGRRRFATAEKSLRKVIGKWIYGTGPRELQEIVARQLTNKKLKIAVAESCTGGYLASRLTDVSGSSEYFERGVVAYSNASKIHLLQVSEKLLAEYGAVSPHVAKAMAINVRELSGADVGLATTGILGPTGDTPTKPLGLIYIGYADRSGAIAQKFQFGSDRNRNKVRATLAALNLVQKKLQ